MRELIKEVEAWTAEAKRKQQRGDHARALALLQRAAEAVPARARLQLETAELARRIGELDVAVRYYRRAAVAYAADGLPRHAATPLRSALQVEATRLPAARVSFCVITRELSDLFIQQGFMADARRLLETSAATLSARGLVVPEELKKLPGGAFEAAAGAAATGRLR